MKEVVRFASILTIVSLIAAGSLAWVNRMTRSKIVFRQSEQMKNALLSVLPGTEKGCVIPVEKDGKILYYKGYGNNDTTQFVGYAFSVSPKGYSSVIHTLVGMDSTGMIFCIKILSEQETPGLGNHCEEIRRNESVSWWQAQFSGKSAIGLTIDKDGGPIQSITGATITSRAITEGIAEYGKSLIEQIHPPADRQQFEEK
jgi:electron transport complex protein RnfG